MCHFYLSFWINVEVCFLGLYIIHWKYAWCKRTYFKAYIIACNLNVIFLQFLCMDRTACRAAMGYSYRLYCFGKGFWTESELLVHDLMFNHCGHQKEVQGFILLKLKSTPPAFRSGKTTSVNSTECSLYTHNINFNVKCLYKFTM